MKIAGVAGDLGASGTHPMYHRCCSFDAPVLYAATCRINNTKDIVDEAYGTCLLNRRDKFRCGDVYRDVYAIFRSAFLQCTLALEIDFGNSCLEGGQQLC